MLLQPKNWREQCQLVALKYAEDTMELFQRTIRSCAGHLPDKKDPAQRAELLDMFIDCTTGLVVQLVIAYTNDLSMEMEEKIISKFTRQFSLSRRASFGGEGDETKVEIVTEDQVN